MSKPPSHKIYGKFGKMLFLLAGLVLVLVAAVPGGVLLDGGGFPTPTPTAAPALAPEPAPTETPTLVPVEIIIPEPSPTPLLQLDSDQPAIGPDNIIANSEPVPAEAQGGFNLLLLGIPILGVLAVLAVVVGFYLRRSREVG